MGPLRIAFTIWREQRRLARNPFHRSIRYWHRSFLAVLWTVLRDENQKVY